MTSRIKITPTRIAFEPWKEEVFGNITANYTAIGTPTTNTVRLQVIQNFTDNNVAISTDGVNNHIPIGAGLVFDAMSNGLEFPKGTQFYIKHLGAAPSSGSVIIAIASEFIV